MITSTIKTNDTIQIKSWTTPVSKVPEKTVGKARLVHRKKYRGLYHFEGMKGFEYYEVTKPFHCTYLQRQNGKSKSWKTWMTDDPTHWTAMKELCKRIPAGRVLCAGLGLGLMVHHLVKRSDISLIRVVELSPDVIKLIKPTLPNDRRIEIVNANFYDYIRDAEIPDCILWDLGVGTPEETKGDFIFSYVQCKAAMPTVPLYQFGLRTADNFFGKEQL